MNSRAAQTAMTPLKDRIKAHPISGTLAVCALVVLIATACYAYVDGTVLAGWETALFGAINEWPDWLAPFFIWMTNIGTIGAVAIAGLVALITHYRRVGLAILLAGGAGWYIAHILKDIIARSRPGDFIDSLTLRYTSLSDGFGFPSGHAAVSAACAMALALILPRKYGIWLAVFALSVGLSRIYLGVHLPLDVIGGWSVGIIAGYVIGFLLQVERKKVE